MELGPGADVTAELGRAIRAARRDSGLSQQELADLVGVDRTYLSALENGRRTLHLERLAQVLDTVGLALTVQPKSAVVTSRRSPGPEVSR